MQVMDTKRGEEVSEAQEGSTEEDAGRSKPFGGMTPAEAGRASGVSKRARKAEREAAAELDKLTVGQRVSTALARELPFQALSAIIRSLATKAQDGQVTAARELRDWLKLAGLDTGDLPSDDVDPSQWTPEQRATARARLAQELMASDESPAQD